jgi:hypothetical protein
MNRVERHYFFPIAQRGAFMGAVRSLLESGDRVFKGLLTGWRKTVFIATIFIVGFACCGAYSVKLGPANNWDLKNYQYYSPYALLTGRYDFDYAPAQIQTYLNPVPLVPFYVVTTLFKPVAAAFIMGGIHGLVAGLLFLTAMTVFSSVTPLARIVLSLSCTALGIYGPTFLPLLGGSGNDSVVSLFVLAGVYAAVRGIKLHGAPDMRESRPALLVSGVLIGIAAGMKLVCIVFLIGYCVAVLIVGRRLFPRLAAAGLSGLAGVVGIIISRGHWMTFLWSRFGSPLFPFYNKIFRSPYYFARNFSDNRFVPKTIGDAVLLPFHFITETRFTRISHNFRDIRYALVYALILLCIVLLVAGLVMLLLRRPFLRNRLPGRTELFLLFFFVVSYVAWQMKFSIMRYIMPLELLAPILIAVLIRPLLPWRAPRSIATVAAFIAVAWFMQQRLVTRREWSPAYMDVTAPHLDNPDETLVIIAGKRPLSYVIPAFQPGIRFVGLSNTFSRLDRTRHEMTREMVDLVESHTGPIYILSNRRGLNTASMRLKRSRIVKISETCLPVETKHEASNLCLWPVGKK